MRVDQSIQKELRSIFDEAAELYQRCRPGYPEELFEDLRKISKISDKGRILEIGPGTGQATRPLADMGYQIIAVELGKGLAEVAKRELRQFKNIEIVNSSFEDWRLDGQFDLVLAATSFHWIDPKVKYVKSAQALKDGGSLAIIDTYHIAGGDQEFFEEVQRFYEQYMPNSVGWKLPPADEVRPNINDLTDSGLFETPTFKRYTREISYTANDYIELLSTYSDHRKLDEESRQKLFDGIKGLINAKFGGQISKKYLTELIVTKKK